MGSFLIDFMGAYKDIYNWLIGNKENEDLTPSMIAHKASKLASQGYSIVDGELVAPDSDSERMFPDEKRKKTIGFHRDTDHEDFG